MDWYFLDLFINLHLTVFAGRKVLVTHNKIDYIATVEKWDRQKPELWHLVHEDEDEEDLDEFEMRVALRAYASRKVVRKIGIS